MFGADIVEQVRNNFRVRSQIKEGYVVKYKGKEYVVIGTDIREAGNCMVVRMVRTDGYLTWQPLIKWVKEIYDRNIEKLEIVRVSHNLVVLD